MPSRLQILANIRQSLGEPIADKQSIEQAYQGLMPHALRDSADNLWDEFQKQLEALGGQVTRVSQLQQVVPIVLEVLKEHQSNTVLMSDLPLCQQLKWPKQINVECRKAEDKDKVSLSEAYAGIAETGSIVMHSSAQTPTTHNFLVDDHIVLLSVSRMYAHLEALWEEFDKKNMPRTVNVLTGPSRTGDVEQTIQIGAHGPLRFHVILVEDKN